MTISEALQWYTINEALSSRQMLKHLLTRLMNVLNFEIPGDVVELGCHAGDTSIFFARMIQELDPSRTLHLYDSFQGLPELDHNDNPACAVAGSVRTSKEIVVQRFAKEGLPQPVIHEGWFKDIPDAEFPEKIAFAFFDGDLYQSIMDSFVKVYPRLSLGAIVCVHDYDVSNWPGTKLACEDFLRDKPETMDNPCFLLGSMVKR